ncbi:SspB family protein [Thermopetrobacter sp. TC1]|uniref:SspB family protein n=1 Tax=Thermopetrobacter sp. TC1 TaxID=1495045 RepID=UPI00068CBA44|nr:ClpXP protease specificity-enhancing factor SspB [Thermopetrobacter sp. TC1]
MTDTPGNGKEGPQGPGGVVDLMRYDLLTQAALRQVIRMALKRVEKEGLPGEHHFYIAFDTRHPGVVLSERLRERYPEEMTIVLQHQFWNLKVHAHSFEVGLSFGGVPERLEIPFEAIKGFFDPSVQFGLQFEVSMPEEGETSEMEPLAADTEEKTASAEEKPEASEAAESSATAEDEKGEDAPKVISLDAFRKK